ncbi:MAG TPA: winged helix-turn-helix domain-containing protein [Terracidiphilus sp.]
MAGTGVVIPERSICFGDCELNASAFELRRGRRTVKLERIPLQVLLILIEEQGKVVTRESIADQIWGKDVFVDVDNGINTAIRKIRQVLNDDPQKPQFVETIPGRGYRFIASLRPQQSAVGEEPVRQHQSAGRARIRSLAVLPLDDHSADAGGEYFADSMTEALITSLAKIRALRVISRTSAMQYRGARKSLPQIARELGVEAVIEGSIMRDGKDVRIAIQLIDAITDEHIFAESYQRDFRDILGLQSDIAREVANKVTVILTPDDRLRLRTENRVDPEVHELYLKARYFWNKRTEESVVKALDHYRKAIDTNPLYAQGYAGLADCYNILGYYNALAPREAYPKARAAAGKALEIDETLAEAHAALGVVKRDFEWDWRGAETEFQRSIQLNPGYVEAYHWRSTLACMLGRCDESICEKERALGMDPLSVVIRTDIGRMFYYSRDYEHSLAHYRAALDLDPAFETAHLGIALVHEQQGQLDISISGLEGCVRRSPNNTLVLARLGRVYALAKRVKEAQEIVERLDSIACPHYVSAYDIALIKSALRDWDGAFAFLEAAFEERSISLGYLGIEPQVDELRSDGRFDRLLHKVGLAEL